MLTAAAEQQRPALTINTHFKESDGIGLSDCILGGGTEHKQGRDGRAVRSDRD